MKRSLCLLTAAVLALLTPGLATRVEAVVITEYGPTAGITNGIAAGPDGNLWFTEQTPDKIGKITTAGVITEFDLTAGSPGYITAGPDGNLWFTHYHMVGKITPGGTITEYGPIDSPLDITPGPDGNLWFTDHAHKIGMITTSGDITEYGPTAGTPAWITTGPDGNLWFTDHATVPNKIGMITSTGVITEYDVTGIIAGVIGIAVGPDGNLWFTEFAADKKIGRITTAGDITEYGPTGGVTSYGITAGLDGNLWFAEFSANKIGKITIAGDITEYGPTDSQPLDITTGSDGNLWFTYYGTNKIGRLSGYIASGQPCTNDSNCESNNCAGAPSVCTSRCGNGVVDPGEQCDDGNTVSGDCCSSTCQFEDLGQTTCGVGECARTVDNCLNGTPQTCTPGQPSVEVCDGLDNNCDGVVDNINSGGVVISEYGPTTGRPGDITAGPDGNLWFTERPNMIGKITTDGVITEYGPTSFGYKITAGPDGNLWFTDHAAHMIGKITTAGAIIEYGPTVGDPYGITAGPDGNLWFTDHYYARIGKITTDGVITEYVPPGAPYDITTGPDGNFWFTDHDPNMIGKITTDGVITEYGPAAGLLYLITAGPDGNLWFTDGGAHMIGKITTGGVITEYGPTGATPFGITRGPDGNLWFVDGQMIGKITTSGVVTEYGPFPGVLSDSITAGSDGNLWFTEGSTGNKIGRLSGFLASGQPCTNDSNCASSSCVDGHCASIPVCPTACGNGVVDPGEQCDDGNTVSGDCCSSTCQFEDLGQTTCGVGACARTVDNCLNGTPQTCTPGQPSAEVCDGLDNDCDGVVDNAVCACGNGIVEPSEQCDDGNTVSGDCCSSTCQFEDLGQTTCGVGACARTVDNCLNGTPQTCTPGQPTAEACDGLDNDCDGVVDDGNPGGGVSCSTGQPGVCAAGTTACTNGAIVCNPNQSPSPEVCDGLDNDCDGVVDNIGMGGVVITELPIPTANVRPNGITAGPDGNVWFVEENAGANSVGRIEVDSPNTITEFPAPTAPTGAVDIATGPDGNLWFTESQIGDKIARITPNSPYTVTEFSFPTSRYHEPFGITAGSDGNMWTADQYGNSIARTLVSSPNTITEFPLPPHSNQGNQANFITSGSDGNLWFTLEYFDRIGRILADSPNTIDEFTVPTTYNGPNGGATHGIATGSDGQVWFVEASVNRIGRIEVKSPNTITEFSIPTANSGAFVIAPGPDGNMWFTERTGNQIGRIEVNSPSTITEFPMPTANSEPFGITAGPDGNLWFTEAAANKIGRLSGFIASGQPCTNHSNCESSSCVDGHCASIPVCPTACGNGVVDPGEQCDDGNTVSGDCCSSTCQFEDLGSTTCGVGGCARTVQNCVSGTPQTCTPGQPSAEVCDGLDNDCDGVVDNGNPGGGVACNTGQLGVCAAGTTACTNGAIVCNPNQSPSPEVCDGLDNDCDGVVDNGNPGGGVACSTGQPGVCAAGTTACTSGAIICNPNQSPSPEVCDGLDNNCDGIVDNVSPGGVVITEYGPTAGTPYRITAGPDGNLWFTDGGAQKIGQITTAGIITEYGTAAGVPADIAAGPDGNLWFTDHSGYLIGKITSGGVITEYGPTAGTPGGITAGPDGNLWFSDNNRPLIGKITPAGFIIEYGPIAGLPYDITAGPDGNLWFTEWYPNMIGKITPAGIATEYGPIGGNPWCITAGADGNLWFTEGTRMIGKITPAGIVTEYGPTDSLPLGIAPGPDGNLWFTDGGANKIGKITTAGVITEYGTTSASAYGITAGPDGNLWFTEDSPNMIGRLSGFMGSGQACTNGSNCESNSCVAGYCPSIPVCPTACGNGVVDPGEQCDDGNTVSGDCCSSTCQFEDLGQTTCGVGECARTVDNCLNGTPQTCAPGQPSPEVCDGVDNDCDGVVDNGNPGGGVACSTGQPGVCAAGTTACTNGAIVCNQNQQPSAEVCDGLDNNCDGIVDNVSPGGVVITEFSIPTANADPSGITAGPDGNVWFAETNAATNSVGRIEVESPNTITEFPAPTMPSGVSGIAAGPDGNVWFTETQVCAADRIARIMQNNTVMEFVFSSAGCHEPYGITAGSDGNMWVAEQHAHSIARVLVSSPNTITEFPLPDGNEALLIASGSDGNLWFTTHFSGVIGRILVDSPNIITEFAVSAGATFGIAAGPDGSIWFVEADANRIGRIEVNSPNTITEFPIPTANSGWGQITRGPDGNMWFTEPNANRIARIQVNSPNTITEFPIPAANSGAAGITVGPDGNLWFTEESANKIARLSGFIASGRPCPNDSNCASNSCVAGYCASVPVCTPIIPPTAPPTNTPTATPTLTWTATRTATLTATFTPTATPTRTPTVTPTVTATRRVTSTRTLPPTKTPTPTPLPHTCGDGVLEPGEQCDDGNVTNGDGCRSDCTYELIPGDGTGAAKTDSRACLLEWYVVNPNNLPKLDRRRRPNFTQRCKDNDPTCDFNAAAGACEFHVVMCLNNADPQLPACPQLGVSNPIAVMVPNPISNTVNYASLTQALQNLRDPATGQSGHRLPVVSAERNLCSVAFPIRVAAGRMLTLRTLARSFETSPVTLTDADRVALICMR